jgi:hypothetical protein
VVAAVAQGGVITFNCGPAPVTIDMYATAKVFNDASDKVVIDGGGKVTLNGRNAIRILYMNTCDPAQNWTTSHCQNQQYPELTVQNLTFINGNSKNDHAYDGGGAIWVRGGRFKIVNSRFFNNVCADTGPDVGGGAARVFSQYNNLPVYVVNSTFGGEPGLGNVCSNAGALSSIGVSWTIINSLFTDNDTTGWGANPAKSGTPGGGKWGGHSPRREHLHTSPRRNPDPEKPRQSRWWWSVLRVEQSLRGAVHHGLRNSRQPVRRL